MELAPALAGADKAVGVDAMAGAGTTAGRVTLQTAATAMRAQDQAKADASTLAKQLSSEISKGLQSISQNFRKGGLVLATSLPIAATPNPAASGTLNAKPSEGGLRQKCRRRSSPVVDRQGQQRQCLGVQPRRQDTEGCSPRRVHRQEAIVCPHHSRPPPQQLLPRKRKRCGASRRRYKSSHKLPSGKKLSAIELIQALRRGRGTGGNRSTGTSHQSISRSGRLRSLHPKSRLWRRR
jgi:hypothetical protein